MRQLSGIAVFCLLALPSCASHYDQAVTQSSPFPVQVVTSSAQPVQQLADVVFYTDPVTGRVDGPFDKATGMRVLTQMGEDGVMRVVLDAVSRTPVLLHEQQAPVTMQSPPVAPTPSKRGKVM